MSPTTLAIAVVIGTATLMAQDAASKTGVSPDSPGLVAKAGAAPQTGPADTASSPQEVTKHLDELRAVEALAAGGGAPDKGSFTNSLGMRFLPVKGTQVLFCIHLTRHKDYAAYVAEVPGVAPAWKNQTFDGHAITKRAEDHPVVSVNWEEAQGFCSWLGKKEGKTYRLPTDKEWSIAVGIGDKEKWTADTTPETVFKSSTDFPWSGQWPPPSGAGNYSDESRKEKAPSSTAQYLEGYDDGYPTTAPVMSFQPNKQGLYDMGGNAWQWCQDSWDATKKDRVLRGGAWDRCERAWLLSSGRLHHAPDMRSTNWGFRVVVVADKPMASGN